MSPKNKWLRWTGFVLNLLVAAVMLMAGSMKLFTTPTGEMADKLTAYGLIDHVKLIGFGEMAAALLMVLPWTSPLGVLATSGFWGGVICLHMSRGEAYAVWSVVLAVTWLGAWLRGSVPLWQPTADLG